MSTDGVRAFMEEYGPECIRNVKVFSIGERTRDLLLENGVDSITPPDHDSDGLADSICSCMKSGDRVIVPRNFSHTDILERRAYECGVICLNLVLYEYVEIDSSVEIEMHASGPDAIGFVFTSPSEVETFHSQTHGIYTGRRCFPLGRTTEKKLNDLGYGNIPFRGNGNFRELIQKIYENSGEWI